MSERKKYKDSKDNYFKELMEKGNLLEILPLFYATIIQGKPFGMYWSDNAIDRLLKGLGYSIIPRINEDTGKCVLVAAKPDEEFLPEYDNVTEVLEEVLQNFLVDYILKFYGK